MESGVRFSGWNAVSDGSQLLTDNQDPQSGRVYTMFHGTYLKYAETIINNGLRPSADGMLGAGVYVSRNIDKAKCYPLNTDIKDSVVFKLKVRVGKVVRIDRDNHPLQKSWHQNGYDCAWVPPHSGISTIKTGREEDCVWDPERIKITGVACCVDEQKRENLRRLIRRQQGSSTCDLCHLDTSGVQVSGVAHGVQRCWACNKTICPFQETHKCTRHECHK